MSRGFFLLLPLVVGFGGCMRQTPLQVVGSQERIDLINALQSAGYHVRPVDRVRHPLLDARGDVLQVNGGVVTVYQYDDELVRTSYSGLISPDGYSIGNVRMDYTERPNFWSAGDLIVLYEGENLGVIRTINGALGDPMTRTPGLAPTREALEAVSAYTGLQREDVAVVRTERVQWSDACLGLPRMNETCAAVLTPGWRILVEAEGRTFVVHADADGTRMRVDA